MTFEGELSSEEIDLVLSVGLNFLMQQGAIPFKVMKENDIHSLERGHETEQ